MPSLEDFVTEQHAALERFVVFWRKGLVHEPEHFPRDMPLGEWDEQFRCFDGA